MNSVNSTYPILEKIIHNCPEYIKKQLTFEKFKIGDIICQQGDIPTAFSILLNGYMKTYYSISIDKKYLVEVLEPGNIFFDIEILDELPCVCSVEAITECTVLNISKNTYIEWLEKDFSFAMYINKRLCAKVYKHITKSTRIMYTVKRRFLEWMITSLKTSKVYPYQINLSKEYIAEELGTTARSINRIIKELSDKNAISCEKSTLYIKSFDVINQELIEMMEK